jgi:hypothetical protein
MRLHLAAALLLLSVLPPLSTPLSADDSKYLVTDLKAARRATYIAIAADALAGDCDALLAHRERRGQTPILVRASDVWRTFGGGKASPDALAAFVKHAADAWGAKFALVVGDVDALPAHVRASEYQTSRWPNDEELGTDHLTAGAVSLGRFPADTREELAAMIAKTIEYETVMPPGPWQRRISFVTGEGGFGSFIDSFLEAQFTKIVTDMIPAPYEIEVAYAKPTSPYSPHPSRFNDNAIRLLNQGSLFFVYVGHGHRTGCDSIEYKGASYPILEDKHVPRIRVAEGRPVVVVIACNTGEFDAKTGDCLGEAMMKSRTGPVAFIGGTRITQPYGNALLGRQLIDAYLRSKPTIGEALFAAKKMVIDDADSDFRKTADRLAGTIMGSASLEPMRKDVILHYNLLGDPALVLRRPEDSVRVDVARDGKRITVSGRTSLKEGRAIVTFDVPREKYQRTPAKIGAGEADPVARYLERYRASNDKSLARAEVAVRDGTFEASFDLFAAPAAGKYVVRAFAWNGTGAAQGVTDVTVDE